MTKNPYRRGFECTSKAIPLHIAFCQVVNRRYFSNNHLIGSGWVSNTVELQAGDETTDLLPSFEFRQLWVYKLQR